MDHRQKAASFHFRQGAHGNTIDAKYLPLVTTMSENLHACACSAPGFSFVSTQRTLGQTARLQANIRFLIFNIFFPILLPSELIVTAAP